MSDSYTFFYGGPLSNFHPSFFIDNYDNVSYSCVEQYYCAGKAKFFKDNYALSQIMSTSNPKKMKRIGRSVKNFCSDRWRGGGDLSNSPAKQYMYKGCYLKFSQLDKFKELLLDTGKTFLVEASPYDCIWGIGMSSDSLLAKNPKFWRGTNWLGEILTSVRDRILEEDRQKLLF